MSENEELQHLQQANQDLREGLKQAIIAIESGQERIKELEGVITSLQERIKTLESQQAKDRTSSTRMRRDCASAKWGGGSTFARPIDSLTTHLIPVEAAQAWMPLALHHSFVAPVFMMG